MTNLEKYKGIIPAFYACYDDAGEISPARIKLLAKHYLSVGVKGLYVGGSSGECIYQSVAERKMVLENVMEAVGGKMTVIAHVAAPSTRDSIELAKHAERLGVDALAAIPPIYYGLPETAIENYWTSIMEATSLDFIIYNIPATTGYALSIDLFRKMAGKPQVIGVKNSSIAVQDIYLFKQSADKEVVIFNGPDEQFVAGRFMGADAGIGGTYGVMPELLMAADDAFKKNDIQLAQKIQFTVDEIIFTMLGCKGNLYAVIKKILADSGLDIGTAREPLQPVAEEDESAIAKVKQLISNAKMQFVE